MREKCLNLWMSKEWKQTIVTELSTWIDEINENRLKEWGGGVEEEKEQSENIEEKLKKEKSDEKKR